MFEPDKIRELINQIPEIRSRFSNEDITFFSGYDFRERKRTNASMGVEMIYKDSKFIRWRDELIIELSALREETIVAEIIHKLQHFTGLGDKKKFDDVESKLLALDKKLDEYKPTVIEKEISDVRIDEEALVKDILMSVVNLQKNHTYTHTSKENEMNDFIRDMLGMKYEKVDQTRQGDSVSGKDAPNTRTIPDRGLGADKHRRNNRGRSRYRPGSDSIKICRSTCRNKRRFHCYFCIIS